MFENLKKFCIRYVKIARNGYLYEKYEKEIRKKILNLKYDLDEIEDFYKEKEKQKKAELKSSIEELQEKNNSLQKVYDEELEKYEKELEYRMECQKRHYELISNQLVIEIQDLVGERAAVERSLEKMKRNIKITKEKRKSLKGIIRRWYRATFRAKKA